MAMTALERKRRAEARASAEKKCRATGWCNECGKKVPQSSSNAFVCSEKCRRKGWRRHNPGQKEPDWDLAVLAAVVAMLPKDGGSYD